MSRQMAQFFHSLKMYVCKQRENNIILPNISIIKKYVT